MLDFCQNMWRGWFGPRVERGQVWVFHTQRRDPNATWLVVVMGVSDGVVRFRNQDLMHRWKITESAVVFRTMYALREQV